MAYSAITKKTEMHMAEMSDIQTDKISQKLRHFKMSESCTFHYRHSNV